MKYSVTLRRFEDDNGQWGFTHDNTFAAQFSFDAFYTANGIMHDLYEHWFEGHLRPFRGYNMCNVYGEMVASAIRLWMYYNAGFNIFAKRGYNGPMDFTVDTIGILSDYMHTRDGVRQNDFPVHAIPIPYQKPFDCYHLNDTLGDYWWALKSSYGMRTLHEAGIKQSLINNAYRYGYKLAERLYGRFDRSELHWFFNQQLEYWYNFTQDMDIQNLGIDATNAYAFKGVQFTLNTNSNKKYPTVKMSAIDDLNVEYPMESIVN